MSIPVVAVDSEEPERDLRLRSLDLFLSLGIKVPIGMSYLVQNRPIAAVELLVGLGEDAPDLEVALLAVERVRGEVHVAPDGHHELKGSLFSLMAQPPTEI